MSSLARRPKAYTDAASKYAISLKHRGTGRHVRPDRRIFRSPRGLRPGPPHDPWHGVYVHTSVVSPASGEIVSLTPQLIGGPCGGSGFGGQSCGQKLPGTPMPGSRPQNASHAAVDPQKGKSHIGPRPLFWSVPLVDVTAQKQPCFPMAQPASDGKQAVPHEMHVPPAQHQL